MRALVVGLGHMGTIHRKVLRDLGYEVDAVDPNPATGAEFPDLMRALFESAAACYDVAAIATPPGQLVPSAFALAGTPMLVEKPFATNPRDADMLGAYLLPRGPVCVGFIERYNPRVRELRERLATHPPTRMKFTRWGDRPCEDVRTDLLIHDVDLMYHLGWMPGDRMALDTVTFDTRANAARKVRRIDVDTTAWRRGPEPAPPQHYTVDLMDHDQSPLHALWHAFLTGADKVPGPADAARALRCAATCPLEHEAVADAA